MFGLPLKAEVQRMRPLSAHASRRAFLWAARGSFIWKGRSRLSRRRECAAAQEGLRCWQQPLRTADANFLDCARRSSPLGHCFDVIWFPREARPTGTGRATRTTGTARSTRTTGRPRSARTTRPSAAMSVRLACQRISIGTMEGASNGCRTVFSQLGEIGTPSLSVNREQA